MGEILKMSKMVFLLYTIMSGKDYNVPHFLKYFNNNKLNFKHAIIIQYCVCCIPKRSKNMDKQWLCMYKLCVYFNDLFYKIYKYTGI